MVNSTARLKTSSEGRERGPVNDPLQHLVDCHDFIEERLKTLERVVPHLRSDAAEKRGEAREALGKALEFLEWMGALHTEDEEASLFPRLLASAGGDQDPTLAELTAMLESQHREKEAVFRKVLAQVVAFPPTPGAPLPEQVRRLEGLVAQLTDLYRPHIMIENERLIPLSAEYLKPSDLEAMREEMRARRRHL